MLLRETPPEPMPALAGQRPQEELSARGLVYPSQSKPGRKSTKLRHSNGPAGKSPRGTTSLPLHLRAGNRFQSYFDCRDKSPTNLFVRWSGVNGFWRNST